MRATSFATARPGRPFTAPGRPPILDPITGDGSGGDRARAGHKPKRLLRDAITKKMAAPVHRQGPFRLQSAPKGCGFGGPLLGKNRGPRKGVTELEGHQKRIPDPQAKEYTFWFGLTRLQICTPDEPFRQREGAPWYEYVLKLQILEVALYTVSDTSRRGVGRPIFIPPKHTKSTRSKHLRPHQRVGRGRDGVSRGVLGGTPGGRTQPPRVL